MQVMVVDDDAVSRLALVDLMQKMNFSDVLEFEDGQAAWEYLEKTRKYQRNYFSLQSGN